MAMTDQPRSHAGLHVPLDFQRMPPEEQLNASREFLGRMASRRSIRSFSAEPVPFELIENAIRCASLAPSGANQQPWTFVVVQDPEVKRQIREAAEAEERESYDRRMPADWLKALAPLGTDWHKEFLETAPYLIVVFRIDFGVVQTDDGEMKTKHYYVQESVGIATGFLLAALHMSGLATLTHTPSPMGFLSSILNRPKNERPFVLIPVGLPSPNATVPKIVKKTIAEVMEIR
jgi:nitroreductase